MPPLFSGFQGKNSPITFQILSISKIYYKHLFMIQIMLNFNHSDSNFPESLILFDDDRRGPTNKSQFLLLRCCDDINYLCI